LVYEAPRTPVEELLAQIWSQVLRVERVGIHDDFFELGGHSLLATRVIAQIREVLQVELPLRALFDEPTIVAQGRQCEAARHSAEHQSLVQPLIPRKRQSSRK
jgi:acyl carrier protein